MSRAGFANKENALQPPTLLAPADSPFSAFLPSPGRPSKSKIVSESHVGPTTTPRKDSKSGGAVRAPLSAVTAVNGSNSPVSRSSSAKSMTGSDSPRKKLQAGMSNSPLRPADDIFSAFISSPPKKSPTESSISSARHNADTTEYDDSKMDISITTFSSPKPARSSVCFDALTRATSKTFDPITIANLNEVCETSTAVPTEITETSVMVYAAASSPSRSLGSRKTDIGHNYNAMEVDSTPVIIAKVELKSDSKRSVAGSPVKSDPSPATMAITPTKSRRQLKHKEKSVKATQRVNIEIPAAPTVSFATPSESSNTSPATDGSDSPAKVIKGSPSRLAKGRLMNRPSYKVRTALVSVPPSNVVASQLKASSSTIPESDSGRSKDASAGTGSVASLASATGKNASHLHTPTHHKSNGADKADVKSPMSPVDPLSATKTRGRSATLDETAHFGSFGGMIGGRMYDAYGFEEAPLRASVNPSMVMIPNPTQESFWTEWLVVTAAPGANLKSSASIPQHTAVLTSMVLSGIPHGLRGRIWPQLLKVPLYRTEHSPMRGYYGELRSKGKHAKWGHQIDLDLHRTFCTHSHFKNEGRGQRQLSNVLNAYSHYNEKIGYCQGMSFLVGVLLMVMDEEERAFWTLCALMDRDEGRLASYYEPGMAGVLRDVDIFRRMLLLETPQLYAHLEKTGVDASFFCARWFLALFTDLSDWTTVLRLWDIYFLQGHVAIFRAALAILKASLSEILALKNAEHLFPFLLNLPFSKLNPSVIISLVRATDIDYLYGEVTAPGAEEKYKVGHIDQPLPPNSSKKSKRDGAGAALQKAISKRKLQQLHKERDEAKAKAEKERAKQGAEAAPTTPLPRKSRPQSMMVFSSHSEKSYQHGSREDEGDDEEMASTPKSASKSFFGRMWDKLKSPSVGSSSKSKPTPSKEAAATPVSVKTPSFAATTTTIPLSTHKSPSSPSRKASRRHLPSSSSATPATATSSPGRSTSKRFIKAMNNPALAAAVPDKKRESPKRRREFDPEEEPGMNASPTSKRYKITAANTTTTTATTSTGSSWRDSWMTSDELEEATAWDGGDDLFMDQGEREAFIAFASSTPIRSALGGRDGARTGTGSHNNKATPRPASVAVSRLEYSSETHVSVTPIRLPPPPGDAHRATPKVTGGPMQLAPAFHSESSSTSSTKTPHHHGSSKQQHSVKSALSPIEMQTAWIPKK